VNRLKFYSLWYKNEESESDPGAHLVGVFSNAINAHQAVRKILNSYKLASRVEKKQFWIYSIEVDKIEMYFHANDSPDAEILYEDACVFELERIRNKEEKWEPLK